jgi:cyclohexanecarboxylate-CoA ligase
MSHEERRNAAGQAGSPDDEAGRRYRYYRDMGWWPGEPLIRRYLRISGRIPDALAVADSRGRELTHRQLTDLAERYAGDLSRSGVRAGDVVLSVLPNRVEWQAVLLAIFQIGAIPATLPVRIDAANLRYVAELAGARALVVGAGEKTAVPADLAVDVAARSPHAQHVFQISEGGDLCLARRGTGDEPERPAVPGLDHLMFTSSTTGHPKAVMHTADTLAALNVTFSERFGLGAKAPIFMPSPLGHSVGAIHGARLSLFNAAPLVLQDQWDPERALTLVDRYKATFTAAATPFLADLLDVPHRGGRSKLDSVRWFLCGGAPVPPALMDRTREAFPQTRVTVLWGMTEGGLTTCVAGSPWSKVRSTCGIGLPGLELETIDREGNHLAAHTEGELVMRGPGVFTGYLRQEHLYRAQLIDGGFFRTGDLAAIDENGYVRITGRLKDLIIRSGVNIASLPIEDALAAHPNVAGVAVIGAPDPRLGERICAVIESKGRRPSLEELVAFVLDRGLPKYHAPELIRYVEAMPRTAAGKIRKIALRPLVETGASSLEGDARGVEAEVSNTEAGTSSVDGGASTHASSVEAGTPSVAAGASSADPSVRPASNSVERDQPHASNPDAPAVPR